VCTVVCNNKYIGTPLPTHRYKLMALTSCLNTLDDQLAFAKQLIKEYDLAYQQHFAAGRLEEMMEAKRKLARQRNIFGRLLKEKMGR
jgi:hypothetical protein